MFTFILESALLIIISISLVLRHLVSIEKDRVEPPIIIPIGVPRS